jgi:uncharacterized protein involved in tolerance to divalent cations
VNTSASRSWGRPASEAATSSATERGSRTVRASWVFTGPHFAPIRTIYRWQGQVYDKTEGRVALRTRRSLVAQIIERARQEHLYEVPSVVAVPIIDGGPDYIDWILEQTESSER